jgi:hypothetical protein
LVQVLLYSDVVHTSVSSSVTSFRHMRTRMQMQDLSDGFPSINYKTTYDNHEEHGWPYSP